MLTGATDRNFGEAMVFAFRLSFGGVFLGLGIGGVVIFFLRRIFKDALIESTLTIAAAYMLVPCTTASCPAVDRVVPVCLQVHCLLVRGV